MSFSFSNLHWTNLLPTLKDICREILYLHFPLPPPAVFCRLCFAPSLSLRIPQFVNPVDKQSFNTAVTLQHLSWENASHFTPMIPVRRGQFWHGCSYSPWRTGRHFVAIIAKGAAEFIRVRRREGRGSKPSEGRKSRETARQRKGSEGTSPERKSKLKEW